MAATLRPRHLSSQLYFSTALISPLQASEQTTANAIPMAHGLRMALRSSGTMIWWRRCSTHGERAKSRWVAAARVGYYCVCVFVGCRKMAEWRGMAGGMAEWGNGGMAIVHTKCTWYIYGTRRRLYLFWLIALYLFWSFALGTKATGGAT